MSIQTDNAFARGAYRYLYRPVDRVTSLLEQILLSICGAAIIGAMLLTTVDVILRYGFSGPLGWSFDLIMLYLMPAAYYLGFSYTLRIGAHLSVDYFAEYLPPMIMRTVYPVVLIVAAALVAYIGFMIARESLENYVSNQRLFGSVSWLTWPTTAIIGTSFLLLAVRQALIACRITMFRD